MVRFPITPTCAAKRARLCSATARTAKACAGSRALCKKIQRIPRRAGSWQSIISRLKPQASDPKQDRILHRQFLNKVKIQHLHAHRRRSSFATIKEQDRALNPHSLLGSANAAASGGFCVVQPATKPLYLPPCRSPTDHGGAAPWETKNLSPPRHHLTMEAS